ncbi:MAG: tripartite tricarboxylate transporter substrate binding protein [Desulfovibrionales bacterium]|nr:tripartite tricarboxylate transporter substrate binding protein [Desulfovibrionales bacterium]
MKLFGKSFVVLALAVAMTLVSMAAFAKYPEKPIKVIVPYGPGGDSDLATRVWANAIEEELGVPVVVINKAGGGGVVGTNFVANAKADGYTLTNAGLGSIQVAPYFSKTPYSFESFTPVVKMTAVPLGIVVPVDSPIKTYDDYIAAAQAKPGKLTCGSWGAASSGTIMSTIIANQLGYQPKYVQASGGALSMVSLIGNHIESAVSFPPIFGPHIESGKARLLVLNKKMDAYPNVPTYADYGVKGSFEGWAGIFAPKGVPQEVVDTLVEATKKVMKDPKVLKAYANMKALVDFRYGPEWIADMQTTNDGMKAAAKAMGK